jgi:hypothetical protein
VAHLAWPFVLDLSRLHGELGIAPDRHYRDALPEVAAVLATSSMHPVTTTA